MTDAEFIAKLDAEKCFVTDVDGFVYWWPADTKGGSLAAHHLRLIADELDRRNAAWEQQINDYFNQHPMLNVEISNREIAAPGLYVMRWHNHTGLVRIVGEPKRGFKIIAPQNAAETYMQGLPENGVIPPDALFSEPLAIVVS